METIDQVKNYLKNSGYSKFISYESIYGVAVYDLTLSALPTGWHVYVTERGDAVATHLVTQDANAAIRLFLQMASARTYLLKTYTNAEDVVRLEALLTASKIPFQRNDVPNVGRLCISVTGSDLLRAQCVVESLDT